MRQNINETNHKEQEQIKDLLTFTPFTHPLSPYSQKNQFTMVNSPFSKRYGCIKRKSQKSIAKSIFFYFKWLKGQMVKHLSTTSRDKIKL